MRSLIVIVASCATVSPTSTELGTEHATSVDEPATQVTPAPSRGRVRYQMRQRLEDLVDLDAALASRDLEKAKLLAYGITIKHVPTAGSDFAISVALDLSRSHSLAEACRLVPVLIGACSSCHGPLPRPRQLLPAPTCGAQLPR